MFLLSCFKEISGNNRLKFHNYVPPSNEKVQEMLLNIEIGKSKKLFESKFGKEYSSYAAQLYTERIGGDMGTLMDSMNILRNRTIMDFSGKDPKEIEEEIKSIVDKTITLPKNFSRFINPKLVSDPSDPLPFEVKSALMIDTLIRCSNQSKGSPLLLDKRFFNSFSAKSKEARIFGGRDLTDTQHILEENDLFIRISDDEDLFQPNRRILIEEWKRWESVKGNKIKLESTRQAMIQQEGIEFPKPKDVEKICARLFGRNNN